MISKSKKRFSIFGFNLKNELSEISLALFFTNIAHSLVSVFVPIYIYQSTSLGLSGVFGFYMLRRSLIVAFSLISGEWISRKGIRPSVIFGGFLTITYFLCLQLLESNPWYLLLIVLLDALKGAFTWNARNTDLAISLDDEHSGAEMAKLNLISTLAKIISPVIGGVIIAQFSYSFLYYISSFFAFIYFIITFLLGEEYFKYNFPSKKVMKRSIDELRSDPVTQYNFLDGTRGVIAGVIWPLLIFLILPDIESIGWLSTLTLLTMTALSFYIAKMVDQNPKGVEKMASRGIVSESVSWVGKLGAFNFYTLFATDMFSQISNMVFKTSMEKINFGSRSKIKNALENIIVREIAISLGQVFMAFLALLLSFVLTDLWTLRVAIISFGSLSIFIGIIKARNTDLA